MSFSPPTIVALATAPGRAGVAVVRLSGPACLAVLQKMCGLDALPKPRKAHYLPICNYRTGEVIDRGLVIYFQGPNSFTGEGVVELHLHGGRAIIQETLDTLCSIDNVRPAEPGEFSRRAFENGKMDLTQAEGIADMVDAETSCQRKQALRQMDGELGRLYEDWAKRLAHNLAFIEAEIDFADEDIPPDLAAGRREDVAALRNEIEKHLSDSRRGERLREGFMIALLGAPNAGKSSLLNALARREAAIVDPTPGTTRDVIEVQLDIGGYPVALADTAGLRESADSIESEGIRRALARAEQADIKLLVIDASRWPETDEATLALRDETSITIFNKIDLINVPRGTHDLLQGAIHISAKTGDGLDELTKRLITEIEKRFAPAAQPALTRARHRTALEECHEHLTCALAAPEVELCAEDLRMAIRALGRITGRVDVEDLLDIIFSSFCIGK